MKIYLELQHSGSTFPLGGEIGTSELITKHMNRIGIHYLLDIVEGPKKDGKSRIMEWFRHNMPEAEKQ